MSGEPGARAVDRESSLRAMLAELGETLERLRERLAEAERPGAERDEHALAIFQEVLSVPPLGLPPGELFALAVDRLSRLLAADRAVLFVLDEASGRLVPRSVRGLRREELEPLAIEPGEGLIGRVFREKRVLIHDAAAPESADPFAERFPVRQGIAVPVRTEGEIGGVLFAGRRALGAPFSTTDVLLLLVLADRVGSTLVHQRLLERHGEHLARLRELRTLVDEQRPGSEAPDILAGVVDAACRLPGVRAALALAGPGPAAVTAAVGAGRMRGVGAGPLGTVGELLASGFAADRPIVVRDLQAREGGAPGPLEREGLRAALLVPLRTRGRVLGLLALADGEPREFSTEEVEMALTLATAAAVALDASAELHALRTTVREQGPRLTRQAEVEQARVLSVLGAGLTRELSGVFAVLLGRSQLLLARAQDESLREGLSVLEEAAWRGTDVVQRLLGLAEADRAPAAPCDLGAIAQEALAFARPRIGSSASRIDMVAELPPTAPVIGSAIALREVVAALVLNAMEAMSGGGTVTVRARDVEGGVELVVADAGEGIGTEAAARVFDPFFTTRPGHLGLGLTVARAVILRAGGRLDLRSGAPGTTVTIWLPAAGGGGIVAAEAPAPTGVRPAPPTPGRPADEPPEPLARPEPPARPDSTEPVAATNGVPAAATNGARSPMAAPGPTPVPEPPPAPAPAAPLRRVGSVLIVEEEDGIRDAVSEALAAAGHHIESAVDADAALDRLARGGVDVVVTDLALRDRSGLQLAAAVKERCPRAAVVLLTGWGRRLHEARVRGAGVDVMVVKPVQPDRVRAAVAEALRLHPSA